MAVLPQLGGLAEAQMRALLSRDSGAALLSAAGNYGYPQQYNNNCAGGVVSGGAQSELTCNGGGGVAFPSRKRGLEAAGWTEKFVSASSALLPVPGMVKQADPVMPSTSGRAAETSSAAEAVVAELCRHGAEMDALVRAECERMRAGLERARKRQRQALVSAVAAAAERRLREKDAELCAARRRAAELEERVRQAAAECQAWCGAARANEAVAAGLRATLDHLLRGGGGEGGVNGAEGCGESGEPVADDDAQSCCFVEAKDTAAADATSAAAGTKWACKACGGGEATVLLLPCRHLCLCKSCEPKMDSCPVCLAAKNASIHIADS